MSKWRGTERRRKFGLCRNGLRIFSEPAMSWPFSKLRESAIRFTGTRRASRFISCEMRTTMSVKIIFEKGEARVVGDGLPQERFDEHELIRTLAREMGGTAVEERELAVGLQDLNRISNEWAK